MEFREISLTYHKRVLGEVVVEVLEGDPAGVVGGAVPRVPPLITGLARLPMFQVCLFPDVELDLASQSVRGPEIVKCILNSFYIDVVRNIKSNF